MNFGQLLRAAYVMAMRLMQSDLYRQLDDEEKAAVDDTIALYLKPRRPK